MPFPRVIPAAAPHSGLAVMWMALGYDVPLGVLGLGKIGWLRHNVHLNRQKSTAKSCCSSPLER